MKLFLLLIFNLFFTSKAFAAACCGGGFATPSLISGDDKAQLTTSYSLSEVVIDNVDSRGIWKKWDEHQKIQTFRIDGAHLISDRSQVGFTVPIIQRSYLEQTHAGLGDTSVSAAYEYLPDWDYNPYRPKGIGFMQLTLPTGKSRAESETGLDSRGNGFWALGVGTLLTKTISHYDFYSSLEVHRSLGKKISNSQINGTLNPGWGGNLSIGAGYSFLRTWRIGSAITWTYEDALNIKGENNIDGSIERYATAALNVSYLLNNQWAGTMSYTDQTLFGNPVNTSLAKSMLFQLQRRWER